MFTAIQSRTNKQITEKVYCGTTQLPERFTATWSRTNGQITDNVLCGTSSVGRARPCQGRGHEFEPRVPLQYFYPFKIPTLKSIIQTFIT